MTVDDAVGLVQNCWDELRRLQTQYPTEPQTIAVRAAAVVNRTITDIRHELLYSRWRDVYERLKLDPLCSGVDRAVGEAGVANLLWELVDRREALGIESPLLVTRSQYRSLQTRRQRRAS